MINMTKALHARNASVKQQKTTQQEKCDFFDFMTDQREKDKTMRFADRNTTHYKELLAQRE